MTFQTAKEQYQAAMQAYQDNPNPELEANYDEACDQLVDIL